MELPVLPFPSKALTPAERKYGAVELVNPNETPPYADGIFKAITDHSALVHSL